MKNVLSRVFGWLPLLLPLYVIRFQIGPLPTTLLEIGIGILTLWWLVERREEGLREAWKRSAPWCFPVTLWMIAGIVATIVSPVHIQALGLFRAYFIEPLIVFFIGLDLIRTEEDRKILWRSFGIVTILLALYAIFQLITNWGIPHPWNVAWPARRATSIFPFPNALSLFVTPIAALAAVRIIAALNQMKEHRIRTLPTEIPLDLITFIAGLIAILCAQSDGGLVALGAATFVAMLVHKNSRRFAIELVILGAILIAAIAPLRQHVYDVALLNDWSGRVRKTIWTETTTMLKDHALPGVGLAAYPIAILPYHNSRNWMEVFQYPHNILLNLWSETGVLGIIAFTWIIITWIKTGRGASRPATLVVVTALLVHGLVDVPYFKNDLAVAFWLLVLLTTVYEPKTTR